MSSKKLYVSGDFISEDLKDFIVLINPKKKSYSKLPLKGFLLAKKTKIPKKCSIAEYGVINRYMDDWTLPVEGIFLSAKSKKIAMQK